MFRTRRRPQQATRPAPRFERARLWLSTGGRVLLSATGWAVLIVYGAALVIVLDVWIN